MASKYKPISGRRSRSGSWQWLILGFIPGLFCGGIVIAAAVIGGLVNLGATEPPIAVTEITQRIVEVVTATPDPNAAPVQAEVVIVTATPVDDPTALPTNVQVAFTATPTTIAIATQPPGLATEAIAVPSIAPALPQTTSGEVIVPASLADLVSLMVTIPEGVFQMGTTPAEVVQAVEDCTNRDGGQCLAAYGEDSSPVHAVSLSPYQIETTEVTFAQYVAFLNWQGPNSHRNGCDGFPCIQTRNESEDAPIIFDSANYDVPDTLDQYPVYGVTWYGARAYCEALGRRLPTEAEWERAARGDDGRIYPWGNDWSPLLAKTNRPQGESPGPLPVANFPAGGSPYGVLDLAGNVAEWVDDWYSPTIYAQLSQQGTVANPTGAATGLEKVLRGGSWDGVPFFARTVHRQSWSPEDSQRWIGFRCAANIGAGIPVGGESLNPETLGVDVPEQAVEPNAQPTLPEPPEVPTEDTSGQSQATG